MEDLNVLINQYKNIDTKLDKISDKVEKLSTETIVQRMDIDHLKAEVVLLKSNQGELFDKINDLEVKPNKEKADRWTMVVNTILKTVAGLFITAMLAYIGVNVK